jgi:hypothetical protein
MGFQHVVALYQGRVTPFIFFNASVALELTKLPLSEGSDPLTIARNGAIVMEAAMKAPASSFEAGAFAGAAFFRAAFFVAAMG